MRERSTTDDGISALWKKSGRSDRQSDESRPLLAGDSNADTDLWREKPYSLQGSSETMDEDKRPSASKVTYGSMVDGKYNTPPPNDKGKSSNSKADDIFIQVDDLKNTAHDTISKLLNRGVKLDELQQNSGTI